MSEMSDDEDNQSLIDEIQALQNVLDQKQTLDNDECASTSAVLKTNFLPKLEKNFETEQSNSDDYVDQDGDVVIDDFYENYNCHDLQDLLELNKSLMEHVSSSLEKMISLLEQCKDKQRLIEEKIAKNSLSWQSKVISFNAGMPYFKDKNYYTAKRNEDTETKIRNGELRLADLHRIHRWTKIDKSNLLKAIRYEVTLTLLNKEDPEEAYIDNSITKTSQLPTDVKKAIGSLGTMKFDWLKIANNFSENQHSAEECEVMWNVFLHPDINKQKWTSKEDKNLNRIVEQFGCEDWDSIAKALNTKRSGYQCFVRYNTSNWKNLMKGQSWSPQDDSTLIYLVSKLKIGDYIPWGYVSSCMNNWTKQQVYYRWNFSLAPHIKKGRFSAEEDNMLLDAVNQYGPNFSKISALVMNNRTNIQLKEHYNTLLAKSSLLKKTWMIEEDNQLIVLKKKYGSNWARIAKEIPNVTRTQVRQRYAALMRYEQKGISLESINREAGFEDPLSTHTTVTYTTNTPWSRESKEIYVKHTRIDEQLVNFFKKDNMQQKVERTGKSYDLDKLNSDTKKLYNVLLKFNANLDLPNHIHEDLDMTEKHQQLLMSLKDYTEERRTIYSDYIEDVRIQMFGPANLLENTERFVPPLPFGFCSPKTSKKKNSNKIDSSFNTNQLHQTELVMNLESNQYVTECLGEDTENQFEKIKKIMTDDIKTLPKLYTLKCKPFANSDFFFTEVAKIINSHNVPPTPASELMYDWGLNRMVSSTSSPETIVTDNTIALPIIEPNRITLQAYQELILVSRDFPTLAPSLNGTNANKKLTSSGRLALDLLKNRYTQLFNVPTGLSRIIPPDIVDESAFLPAVEKFKKKTLKKSVGRKRIKK